jgi:hypothetical protein
MCRLVGYLDRWVEAAHWLLDVSRTGVGVDTTARALPAFASGDRKKVGQKS